MGRRALLDVNVLVALLDAGHLHHRSATDWLVRHRRDGWASCPLTQNGCIRIMSLPAYGNPQPPGAIAERLAAAAAAGAHAFWCDDFSLLEPGRIAWRHVTGSRQVTDLYLLALAAAHDGCFVSFDRGVALDAVPAAQRRHLVVLGA